jgi:hypothetical protein
MVRSRDVWSRRGLAVLAASLLLLGLGRVSAPSDSGSAATASSVGHQHLVVAAVAAARSVAADPGSRAVALPGGATTSAPAPVLLATADRAALDVPLPLRHLLAGIGDRAPPLDS